MLPGKRINISFSKLVFESLLLFALYHNETYHIVLYLLINKICLKLN
jgi:hypothetical protein